MGGIMRDSMMAMSTPPKPDKHIHDLAERMFSDMAGQISPPEWPDFMSVLANKMVGTLKQEAESFEQRAQDVRSVLNRLTG
jgi:hypothetical protein